MNLPLGIPRPAVGVLSVKFDAGTRLVALTVQILHTTAHCVSPWPVSHDCTADGVHENICILQCAIVFLKKGLDRVLQTSDNLIAGVSTAECDGPR
jgi:hypothetical protein